MSGLFQTGRRSRVVHRQNTYSEVNNLTASWMAVVCLRDTTDK